MENLEEKFEELVKKAQEEANRKAKKVNNILLGIEMSLQVIGLSIIYFKLGGWVTFGLFLLLTGTNMQNTRNNNKK
jgi:hypothetical protein